MFQNLSIDRGYIKSLSVHNDIIHIIYSRRVTRKQKRRTKFRLTSRNSNRERRIINKKITFLQARVNEIAEFSPITYSTRHIHRERERKEGVEIKNFAAREKREAQNKKRRRVIKSRYSNSQVLLKSTWGAGTFLRAFVPPRHQEEPQKWKILWRTHTQNKCDRY